LTAVDGGGMFACKRLQAQLGDAVACIRAEDGK
jgi:hypothetical protein